MKFVFIIFFALGMYVYTLIPKDFIPIEKATVIPIAKAIYFDEAGKHCVIYNSNPSVTATCQKK